MKTTFSALALCLGLLPVAVQAQTIAPEQCAIRDFADFVATFSADPESQRGLSADPVVITIEEMGDDYEPVMRHESLAHESVDWPILPSILELAAQDLEVFFNTDTPGKGRFVARGREDGRHMTWEFTLAPCWQFSTFIDAST